jgi:hypothetical protein
MAITSAKAAVQHAAPAKIDEQGVIEMAKKKRHSRVEIATKLAQANDLAAQGKLQSEIARMLGVSVMTLHRWRTHEASQPDLGDAGDEIAELELENSRLRRLVTDLLLEKIKLEEAGRAIPAGADGHA